MVRCDKIKQNLINKHRIMAMDCGFDRKKTWKEKDLEKKNLKLKKKVNKLKKQLLIHGVVNCKKYDFERTIDLLDDEIDSFKDAYHQESIVDRKTVYSSMILEILHAKKKLKQ